MMELCKCIIGTSKHLKKKLKYVKEEKKKTLTKKKKRKKKNIGEIILDSVFFSHLETSTPSLIAVVVVRCASFAFESSSCPRS